MCLHEACVPFSAIGLDLTLWSILGWSSLIFYNLIAKAAHSPEILVYFCVHFGKPLPAAG